DRGLLDGGGVDGRDFHFVFVLILSTCHPGRAQREPGSITTALTISLDLCLWVPGLPSVARDDSSQKFTLSPPLSTRISRASSGVAISNPSPSMIWRALVTCCAFDSASLPGPIQSESSRPTRTLPPIAAACAAIGIWLRPAPSTDQRYVVAPRSRSAVRFMCSTSSGCAPIPPRMPNTDCTKNGGL